MSISLLKPDSETKSQYYRFIYIQLITTELFEEVLQQCYTGNRQVYTHTLNHSVCGDGVHCLTLRKVMNTCCL